MLLNAKSGAARAALLLSAALLFGAPDASAARRAPPAIDPGATRFPRADSLEGNYLAAYIAGASRDTAAAANYYREAMREDPRNPELLERAFVSLLADGDLAAATRTAERLVQRDPANGLAQLALGIRSFKARQYAGARSYLARGGRSRTADLTATLLTAWSYAGSRDGRKALEVADSLKGERGFAVFRDYHAGLIASVVGMEAEAERRLKSAYDADKTTLRIADAYARVLARHGQKDAALQVYRDFDAVAPRHPLVVAATEALNAGKPLSLLVSTAPEGAAEVLYGLGSAGSQQGDDLASIIYLRLALQLNPDQPLAIISLADVFERMKRTEQSIDTLKLMPATSPMRPAADVQIALSLEQIGRGEEAVKMLEALQAARPDDNEVLIALGNVYRSRKQYAEAAAIYGRAIARTPEGNPGLWPLYYYRGTAYERAKEWGKAESDLRKALSLVPENQPIGRSQVLNYLGYSWVDQNSNLDEAFKMLKRAVELNPRDGMIIDSLGWAHYRFGQYDEAVRELEKAAELKAGDPVINDHLGDAYWRVGRRLEAKFQWQHAKDSNPEPDDLKLIDQKLANGLPDEPKPVEAETKPAATDAQPAAPEKSGG